MLESTDITDNVTVCRLSQGSETKAKKKTIAGEVCFFKVVVPIWLQGLLQMARAMFAKALPRAPSSKGTTEEEADGLQMASPVVIDDSKPVAASAKRKAGACASGASPAPASKKKPKKGAQKTSQRRTKKLDSQLAVEKATRTEALPSVTAHLFKEREDIPPAINGKGGRSSIFPWLRLCTPMGKIAKAEKKEAFEAAHVEELFPLFYPEGKKQPFYYDGYALHGCKSMTIDGICSVCSYDKHRAA